MKLEECTTAGGVLAGERRPQLDGWVRGGGGVCPLRVLESPSWCPRGLARPEHPPYSGALRRPSTLCSKDATLADYVAELHEQGRASSASSAEAAACFRARVTVGPPATAAGARRAPVGSADLRRRPLHLPPTSSAWAARRRVRAGPLSPQMVGLRFAVCPRRPGKPPRFETFAYEAGSTDNSHSRRGDL